MHAASQIPPPAGALAVTFVHRLHNLLSELRQLALFDTLVLGDCEFVNPVRTLHVQPMWV